jgi:hypothetical protein
MIAQTAAAVTTYIVIAVPAVPAARKNDLSFLHVDGHGQARVG